MDQKIVTTLVEKLLGQLETNSQRDGLQQTPSRVAKLYQEILSGYEIDVPALFTSTFAADNQNMIIVKDIPFYSLCEHHLVPFFGTATIGYIPKDRVLGLSKFARLVSVFARRLTIQERLTEQIAGSIDKHLNTDGVMVVIKAEHLCMSMRGVQKPGIQTITSCVKGVFAQHLKTRMEFLELIKE